MTGREQRAGNGNGNGAGYLDDVPIERLVRDMAPRVDLTWNRLDAHVKDTAAWRKKHDESQAIVEQGVLELVASNRDQKKEIGEVRTEVRFSLSEIREDLKRASRVSQVDEEERKIVHNLAQTGADAARALLNVQTTARTKEAELVAVDQADMLQARKDRRALVVAGAKKVAAILGVPILTAIATAAAILIGKGC